MSSRMPLSHAQERLWFLQQLRPRDPAYNEPICVRLTGHLDVAALNRSLAAVVARHEILRSTFEPDRGGVRQIVHTDDAVPATVVNHDTSPQSERVELIRQESTRLAREPFDLRRLPLLRPYLLRLAEDDHAFLLVAHHILLDGPSEETLLAEIAARYSAETGFSATGPLAPVTQAGAIAVAERAVPPDSASQRFWLDHLHGTPTGPVIPASSAPVPEDEAELARTGFNLDPASSKAVFTLARALSTSPFSILRTVYELSIAELTRATDFVIGCPYATRYHTPDKVSIGFFTNLLAIRSSIRQATTFAKTVERVSLVLADALSHGDYPYSHLTRDLRARGTPLRVEQAFAMDIARPLPPCGSLVMTRIPLPPPRPRFDLVMTVTDTEGTLSGTVDHSLGRVDPEFVPALVSTFRRWIHGVARHPTLTL